MVSSIQEQRVLSAPLSRSTRKNSSSSSSSIPCCYRLPLLIIMLTPLAIVLSLIGVLSIINDANRNTNVSFGITSTDETSQGHKSAPSLSSPLAEVPSMNTNAIDSNNNLRAANNLRHDRQELLHDTNDRETLVLDTSFGPIRIVLRPDLSQGSVDYIRRLIDVGCRRCNLYRAEKPGILQGVMANKDVPTNTVFGSCPDDGNAASIKNECPTWDPNCGCHGPLMSKGSVAWAAGQAGGPDFFIDNYKRPATWWGTQHTNFGFIEDKDSLHIIDTIFEQPTRNNNGMHILEEKIPFKMEII